MNFFENIIMSLKGTMETPTNYGWFHLMFIAIAIITTVFLCVFARNVKDKTFRYIIMSCWILVVVLEIYKQLVFSYDIGEGWHYQWYAFPYQLCSTSLYLLPFVAFLKDGHVRDSIMAFLGTFVFFAGFAVFLYPNDVFIGLIGINIQTMVHHGLQIVLGIYIMVYYRKKLNIKFYLKSLFTFAATLTVAIVLNLIVHAFIPDTFNMFYISPYFDCTLPVLSMIYPLVPYPLFLLIYIVGFALAAIVMFYIFYFFVKVLPNFVGKRKNKLVAQTSNDINNETLKELKSDEKKD